MSARYGVFILALLLSSAGADAGFSRYHCKFAIHNTHEKPSLPELEIGSIELDWDGPRSKTADISISSMVYKHGRCDGATPHFNVKWTKPVSGSPDYSYFYLNGDENKYYEKILEAGFLGIGREVDRSVYCDENAHRTFGEGRCADTSIPGHVMDNRIEDWGFWLNTAIPENSMLRRNDSLITMPAMCAAVSADTPIDKQIEIENKLTADFRARLESNPETKARLDGLTGKQDCGMFWQYSDTAGRKSIGAKLLTDQRNLDAALAVLSPAGRDAKSEAEGALKNVSREQSEPRGRNQHGKQVAL